MHELTWTAEVTEYLRRPRLYTVTAYSKEEAVEKLRDGNTVSESNPWPDDREVWKREVNMRTVRQCEPEDWEVE